MDVLLLSGNLAGGAPEVCLQVSKHLPSDIDPTVAYLGGRDDLRGQFESAGIPVVRIADEPISWRSLAGVHGLLKNGSFDLVNTHMMLCGLIGRPLARLNGLPVVHTVHTNYEMRPPTAKYPDLLSAPFGDLTVCVSESVRASLPRFYCSETEVIHNCIDIEEVRQRGVAEWDELDWTSDLDPDAPIVANIARYDPKKRRRDLIEGFVGVVADHPDAQLVLTGRRDDRQARLADLADRHGIAENVHFVGFVDNQQTVYHHADLIAFASESEGFSIGMLEAMAHSRPIVATDIPAFVEALGKEYSELVPVRSPPELGAMISDLLSDGQRRERASDIISTRIQSFSGAVAANEYAELYRTVGRR
jgi:phosphatidylinositol alpha-mannosyltransferase